jgi:hypothetical protein
MKNEDEKIQHELEDRLRSLATTKEELEVKGILYSIERIYLFI